MSARAISTPARLTFEAETHTYRVDGAVVPSVTQVLEPLTGLEFVDDETLAIAAEFGTHVHKAVQLHNEGRLDRASLSPAIEPYLAGWERFVAESGIAIIDVERAVYHGKMRYAGTLDARGYFPDNHKVPALIDVKTGSGHPRTVGPQTAAYEAALVEAGLGRHTRFCCLLRPNTYTLKPLANPNDINVFKAALTIHRWRHNT